MRIEGREIPPDMLEQLKDQGRTLSRRAMARHLCSRLGWLSPSGRPPLMAARKILAHLTRLGHLPPPLFAPPPPRRVACSSLDLPSTPIAGELDQFQPLEWVLLPPGPSALSSQWTQWLDRFHFLGSGPLCGAQLRYLVRSPQGDILAALAFSAPARHLRGRDCWIQWSSEARRQNLHLVVNNSRFLIPPHVQIPNLASHILSLILQRLPEDWRARFGYAPVLVETFVEHARFQGGSYQAANWQAIALTQGRGRQDRGHGARRSGTPLKTVWVCPLRQDFRSVLCQESASPRLPPRLPPAPPAPIPPPADWAEEEFGRARLGDRRLVRRGCELARDFYAHPQSSLPLACGSRAKTKAAYRFFDNPVVTMTALLESHYQATAARAATESVVLAVQDTTSLNYSTRPATEMLGTIGTEADGPMGILVHSTLAFNLAGTPLGLMDVQSWTRDPEDFGKKLLRYELPFEEKESVRWLRSLEALERLHPQCPNTRLVSVGDREADIYELFVWATEKENRPDLLVRAEHRRTLADEQGDLWSHVEGLPSAGEMDVCVPRRGNRPMRHARLEVRYAEVELQPPKRKRELGPVRVRAILARETGAPAGSEALEWMLLTTLEVRSLEEAVEKLGWYSKRWGIEVFHRILKSGCQIETRQLRSADRLEACMAIDMVVAWRIFHLAKLGRETPDVPCTVYFQEHEWKALMIFVTRCRELPSQPPTLREAQRMVAQLGGFLGRKGDGEPGTQTLWLGLQRLDDIAEMFLAMSAPQFSSDAVSRKELYG